MFVVGFTAGGMPFGVDEGHDDLPIDDSDIARAPQEATDEG